MIDKQHIYSEDQAITADAASTNIVDLGALVDDRDTALSEFGPEGGKLRLVVIATEAFNNLTDVKFSLQECATEGGTYTEVISKTVALAALTLNAEILNIQLLPGLKRYTRMYYDVTGTAPTTGKVTAVLAWGHTS